MCLFSIGKPYLKTINQKLNTPVEAGMVIARSTAAPTVVGIALVVKTSVVVVAVTAALAVASKLIPSVPPSLETETTVVLA